jgi:vacuolar-type H+-ATPase subunit E/Vma4
MANREKHGGRSQGTPNVITREIREVLKRIISNELDQLEETLSGMDPAKRLEVVIKLIPYVLPKVEPVPMGHSEPWQV